MEGRMEGVYGGAYGGGRGVNCKNQWVTRDRIYERPHMPYLTEDLLPEWKFCFPWDTEPYLKEPIATQKKFEPKSSSGCFLFNNFPQEYQKSRENLDKTTNQYL